MSEKPFICLTFDVEEFDVITEFGGQISPEKLYEPGFGGLDKLLALLKQEGIAATLFCTANYVRAQTGQIARAVADGHEIASHGLNHSRLEPADIAGSKEIIESLLGCKLRGFRAPRFAPVSPEQIAQAGYDYDSSINPTWLPGRYNYSTYPKTPFEYGTIIELPASVTPRLRFPLFWLSFKNLPFEWYVRACLRTLGKHGCLNLVFHPWEFSNLGAYALPWYVKRIDGDVLTARLQRLIGVLRAHGEFVRLERNLEHFTTTASVESHG